jgi:hypothetical protein
MVRRLVWNLCAAVGVGLMAVNLARVAFWDAPIDKVSAALTISFLAVLSIKVAVEGIIQALRDAP